MFISWHDNCLSGRRLGFAITYITADVKYSAKLQARVEQYSRRTAAVVMYAVRILSPVGAPATVCAERFVISEIKHRHNTVYCHSRVPDGTVSTRVCLSAWSDC